GENVYLCGVRGERAGMDHVMENLQKGTVKLKDVLATAGIGTGSSPVDAVEAALITYAPGNLKNQRAGMLRLMTEMGETAQLPPEQQRGPNRKQIDLDFRNLGMLLRSVMPAMSKVAEANQRSLAQLRCASAALAAERYRRAHGDWPASLEQLVADGLLKQVP